MIKNAIVWGASGGIGRALVEQLGADGWTVFAVSRHSDEWAGRTPGVIGIEADVASPAEVERAITAISQEVTEVQLSIYAAGDITSARTKELSAQNWNRILDANLTGVYLTTHYSLPLLAADGHLVFLGAISERLRLPGLGAYAAAKAGLEAFAEALGKEERKRRVTVVRPAAVETPLWDKVPMRLPAHALSPQTVAERILEAYREGHKGSLDLA